MKINKTLFLLFLFFISGSSFAQRLVKQNKLRSKFVLEKNKNEYYTKLTSSIYKTLQKSITASTEKEWRKALIYSESLFLKDTKIFTGIKKALSIKIDKFVKLQRAALEVAYASDQNKFTSRINKIFKNTKDITSYAISVNYLLRENTNNYTNKFFLNNLKKRFSNWEENPTLISLNYYLENSTAKILTDEPPLKDLLTHSFQKGKTIIYTFLRKNRNYPGITIIKKPDGKFVKNKNGSLFYIPQLAISFSNLPGYIPNGNTPTGIYSVVGTYISPTESIGPTPNILVRSPFEVSPEIFFHKKNKYKKFSEIDYKNLLPKSWQGYFPIYQSFYSGKTGRKLIIIHGSTDDLSYYKNLPYYPMSPTRGCLSSKEIWDSKTGKCLESDQVKLINAFRSTKQNKGFLVVIEIDNKQNAVTIDEIKNILD
jgi:hypothetical protein